MNIKIPQNGKLTVKNSSDLFGNIWYTKNIDFDEEGYTKLSSRAVSILNEEDASYLETPTAFGRSSGVTFFTVTFDSPVDIILADNNIAITEDTGINNPSFGAVSNGIWWQNRWHATSQQDLYYKTTVNGTWTTAIGGNPFTSSFTHPVEVFRNRTTLCVGNGNVVKQYTTVYGASTDLTLPSDYEVKALAYSNNRMGIATKLQDGVVGQNQDALFFVWDGASTSANSGHPVGSDRIICVKAYKSSWVIITRTGEVLFFNGTNFDKICDLGFFFKNVSWGDILNEEAFGDIMQIEGDLIYFNINNAFSYFGEKAERYLENTPGGILCYDPKVGLYHRYSPSLSKASFVTVTSANVNTTSDIFTSTTGTLPTTGNPIKYLSNKATQIGGLNVGTVYFIIRHTSTTFSLATSYQDAIDGNKLNITSTGDTNNYFLSLNVEDFGASRPARTGAIALMGQQAQAYDHIIFGGEIYDTNSSTAMANICLTVGGFENRGYLVSPKIVSQNIEDINQKIYIKYEPLNTGDSLVVKYKDKNVIGIPVTTPQYTTSCAWSDGNTLTTNADLSEVKTYLDADVKNECELEVISGAGAGQMSQISSITYSAPTYTVNLVDTFVGAVSGNVCDIIINNWKLLGTIDDTDTNGYKEFPVATSSKWIKYKVELRGVDTTIEELNIVNKTQIPAI